MRVERRSNRSQIVVLITAWNVQSRSQIVTANIPTSSSLQAGCPSLSSNKQYRSTEVRKYHNARSCSPQADLGLPSLFLPSKALGYLGEGCQASRQLCDALPHYQFFINKQVTSKSIHGFELSSIWKFWKCVFANAVVTIAKRLGACSFHASNVSRMEVAHRSRVTVATTAL